MLEFVRANQKPLLKKTSQGSLDRTLGQFQLSAHRMPQYLLLLEEPTYQSSYVQHLSLLPARSSIEHIKYDLSEIS